MPHKHNDIKHGVDPEQIRRYLAGELDDKAMHLLEKQALDDPFLAEALEGFAEHTPDQQLNLADLESRLEKRVAAKKERKLPVYYRWAAAAAILLLAGVGVMKMWELPQKKEMAKNVVPHDSVAPAAITDESGRHSDALANYKSTVPAIEKPLSVPELSVPPRKKEVMLQQSDAPAGNNDVAYEALPSLSKAKQEADMMERDTTVMENVYAAAPAVSAPVPEKKKDAAVEIRGVLSGKAAGVRIGRMAQAEAQERTLTGKVTDNNMNPLPFVSVFVNNTRNGMVTDRDGNFALKVDNKADVQLNINYPGYESKRLQVNNTQNNLNIAIEEAHNALNEVVVTGYNAKRNKVAYQAPLPEDGFDSYQEYLVKHVRYPASAEDIKGTVRVGFTVKADGTLEKFRIIKKLQPDCDTEAIRVIKEGPAWTPASNGKSRKVKVDVPFTP